MTAARSSRRVLYLGGRTVVREAMRAALSRYGFDLVPAVSVREALDMLDAKPAVVALVDDEGFTEAEVLEAIDALTRKAARTRVGVLSASRSPVFPADAIRSGAGAFCSKDMPLAELRYAIERMLQGHLVVDPMVTRTLLGIFREEMMTPPARNGFGQLYLTAIEKKVLTLAAEGKVNKQIAHALGLSPLTVKNHIARIRARLGAADKAQAVAVAIRAGLLS